MIKTIVISLALLLGVLAEANGALMLIWPEAWYWAVPGVAITGPFNQHFIRDIGLIYLLIGGGFLFGAAKPHLRVVVWAATTIWLSGHALFHFCEVAVGICGTSTIVRDFAFVTLPALLGGALTLWAWREARRSQT